MAYDLCESESSEIIDVVPFILHIVNSLNCKILSIYPLKKKKQKMKKCKLLCISQKCVNPGGLVMWLDTWSQSAYPRFNWVCFPVQIWIHAL